VSRKSPSRTISIVPRNIYIYTFVYNAILLPRGGNLMALSIKKSETERLARMVAKKTGESLTKAIEQALKERLERLQRKSHAPLMTEKLQDILRRVDALPTLDSRPADEILGYDEIGVPR
jgi:antitoxin VapB